MPSAHPTNDTSGAPPRPARVLALSILIVTLSTQPVFLLAAGVGQAGPELGFDAVGLGLLTTAFFTVAALASAPAGKLVERIGWPRAMRLTLGGAVVSLVSIAWVGRSIPAVLGLLVLGAGVYSFANPAANAALAQHAHRGREATFFGLKHAGIPGSALLAGMAVPLINLRFGWRWSYVVAAVLALALLAVIPRRAGNGAVRAVPSPPTGEMSRRELRRLAVVASLIALAPGALGTFTVAGAIDTGLSEAAAGWTFFLAGLASIAARASYGVLVDRFALRPVVPLFVVVALGSVSLMGVAAASGGWFVPAVVLAFMIAWGWPGLLTFTVVEANASQPAAASAVTQAGVFVGAAVGPPMFGWLVDGPGFATAWVVVAVCVAVGAVILLPGVRPSPRGRPVVSR